MGNIDEAESAARVTRRRQTSAPTTKSMEQMLWNAACSIRGEKDAAKFKDYLLPLLFLKRLSDVFDDEINRLRGIRGPCASSGDCGERPRVAALLYTYALLVLTGKEYDPMDATMQNRWMTLQEVAEYLQLSKDMIYRLAQSGRIPASKGGSRWRFRQERIDRWMEDMAVDTPTHGRSDDVRE